MIVSKKFKWEAAHRIPWHEGKCKHLHGHSYKMIVELEGEPNEKGVVIDFNDIKKMIEPYVKMLDHSTIISSKDEELKEVFVQKSWKHFLLPFDSTAENLCNFFLNTIINEHAALLSENQITSVGVKIYETETAYSFAQRKI